MIELNDACIFCVFIYYILVDRFSRQRCAYTQTQDVYLSNCNFHKAESSEISKYKWWGVSSSY